jgi:hypothetical protein
LVFAKYVQVEEAGYPETMMQEGGDLYICRYGSAIDTEVGKNVAAMLLSGSYARLTIGEEVVVVGQGDRGTWGGTG